MGGIILGTVVWTKIASSHQFGDQRSIFSIGPDSPQGFSVSNVRWKLLTRCPRIGDQRVEVQSLSQGKSLGRGEAEVSIGLRLKGGQVKWVGGKLLNLPRLYILEIKKRFSTLITDFLGV